MWKKKYMYLKPLFGQQINWREKKNGISNLVETYVKIRVILKN